MARALVASVRRLAARPARARPSEQFELALASGADAGREALRERRLLGLSAVLALRRRRSRSGALRARGRRPRGLPRARHGPHRALAARRPRAGGDRPVGAPATGSTKASGSSRSAASATTTSSCASSRSTPCSRSATGTRSSASCERIAQLHRRRALADERVHRSPAAARWHASGAASAAPSCAPRCTALRDGRDPRGIELGAAGDRSGARGRGPLRASPTERSHCRAQEERATVAGRPRRRRRPRLAYSVPSLAAAAAVAAST